MSECLYQNVYAALHSRLFIFFIWATNWKNSNEYAVATGMYQVKWHITNKSMKMKGTKAHTKLMHRHSFAFAFTITLLIQIENEMLQE